MITTYAPDSNALRYLERFTSHPLVQTCRVDVEDLERIHDKEWVREHTLFDQNYYQLTSDDRSQVPLELLTMWESMESFLVYLLLKADLSQNDYAVRWLHSAGYETVFNFRQPDRPLVGVSTPTGIVYVDLVCYMNRTATK